MAVLSHGGLYALGRALAYIVIGFLLVKSLLSAPSFSFFMQKYGNQALSPILILAGMYMLDMFGRSFGGFNLFDLSNSKPGAGDIIPRHGLCVRSCILPYLRSAVFRSHHPAGG